jgi:putative tryptophan/tyrosine transport system substrate-binding protein
MKRRALWFCTILVLRAAFLPAAATAQQIVDKVYRVGVLASNERHLPEFEAFREQLRDLGYIEGRNLLVDWRYAKSGPSQLPVLAKELAGLQPDVLVSISTPATTAVKAVAGNVPVVFSNIGDPVGQGLVASLARPGGNITGQSILAPRLSSKRVELLKKLIPAASTVAVLWNSTNPAVRLQWRQAQEAALVLGVRLISLEVREATDIAPAFEVAKRQGADGLIVLPDPTTGSHRSAIIDLAAGTRMPAQYGYREYADSGGLITFGPSYPAMFRRTAIYVDKIFKGAKPSDLPVEQPTTFELVVNLKTAALLGLTFPPLLLARADEVIE